MNSDSLTPVISQHTYDPVIDMCPGDVAGSSFQLVDIECFVFTAKRSAAYVCWLQPKKIEFCVGRVLHEANVVGKYWRLDICSCLIETDDIIR